MKAFFSCFKGKGENHTTVPPGHYNEELGGISVHTGWTADREKVRALLNSRQNNGPSRSFLRATSKPLTPNDKTVWETALDGIEQSQDETAIGPNTSKRTLSLKKDWRTASKRKKTDAPVHIIEENFTDGTDNRKIQEPETSLNRSFSGILTEEPTHTAGVTNYTLTVSRNSRKTQFQPVVRKDLGIVDYVLQVRREDAPTPSNGLNK